MTINNETYNQIVDIHAELDDAEAMARYVDPQAAKVNLEVQLSKLEDQLWYELPSCGNDEEDWAEYQHLLLKARLEGELPF
jgi:hypothetical protein